MSQDLSTFSQGGASAIPKFYIATIYAAAMNRYFTCSKWKTSRSCLALGAVGGNMGFMILLLRLCKPALVDLGWSSFDVMLWYGGIRCMNKMG